MATLKTSKAQRFEVSAFEQDERAAPIIERYQAARSQADAIQAKLEADRKRAEAQRAKQVADEEARLDVLETEAPDSVEAQLRKLARFVGYQPDRLLRSDRDVARNAQNAAMRDLLALKEQWSLETAQEREPELAKLLLEEAKALAALRDAAERRRACLVALREAGVDDQHVMGESPLRGVHFEALLERYAFLAQNWHPSVHREIKAL